MDMQTMKHIDRLAGNPLCGALRVYDVIRGGRARRGGDAAALPKKLGPAGRPPRIAVIKFWGMGSLILAAPLFYSLRRSYPESEISLITLGHNRGIIELLDLADRVVCLDLPEGAAGIAGNIAGLMGRVRGLRADAVIDLEYLTRFSAIVSYLSGAPVRVGFHSWDVWRGNLHTARRAFNPYWHVTENFLNLHRALSGEEGVNGPVRVKLNGDEDREARELLAAAGVGEGERLIAFNTNASTMALERRWPDESFAGLIDRVMEAGLGRAALLGAPEEAAHVERVRAMTRRPGEVVNLAGLSSLSGLCGILRRAAMLVTNDSGPLHLAGALGTRTMSFFGPETPVLFGPRGEGHVTLYRGIDCSPCISIYNAKTVRCLKPEPACLSGIGVDEAFEALKRALGADG
jgi:ADP-heptose:LPS heptosyltransferase